MSARPGENARSGGRGLYGFFATDDQGRVELGYVIHADRWSQGSGLKRPVPPWVR